jgi:serine phosphatase RsbU (regulator of sigma subunit)
VFQDTASDPRFLPWRAEALKRGYAACVGIPLIAGSTTLGALTIYAAERDAFGSEEVELLTELADDLAFGVMTLRTRAERKKAIELHAAHERETRIGFEIQQTLLLDPLPADLPGLRVAALTVPSRQVDGDFYHFYRHENGSLDVIVADVMGKGIPAALLAAATKSHFLKALVRLLGTARGGGLPEPKDIVTLAHAEMGPHLIELESFVTLCYARIDPNRGTLDLVDCGHTGLIHRHARAGVCETVHGDNLALGMREGEVFEQLNIPFETGDLLLLFSDGITETRNSNGELFGEGRLVQCIQANSGLSPEDLVREIRRAAFAFSGAEVPGDDLTCVAVLAVERQLPPAHREPGACSELEDLARPLCSGSKARRPPAPATTSSLTASAEFATTTTSAAGTASSS